MCIVGFSSEKTRYGRSALSFYFTKIFYIDIAFFHYISLHFSACLTKTGFLMTRLN